MEIVTYGASEETPAAEKTKDVVDVAEASQSATLVQEARAEVVHRRWERHPKDRDGSSSDGGDIAVDYGVSTDEEDANAAAKSEEKVTEEKGEEGDRRGGGGRRQGDRRGGGEGDGGGRERREGGDAAPRGGGTRLTRRRARESV